MDLEYQLPESPAVEMEIDRGKTWSFALEDVDVMQSDVDLMNDWAEDASQRMKISVDRDVLAYAYTEAQAVTNAGNAAGAISQDIRLGAAGDPLVLTSASIVDTIVDFGTALDENDIPETDRWLVLPTAIAALVKKSELKDASIAGDGSSIVRSGRLGIIDRFTIYSSNLMSSTPEAGGNGTQAFNIMAGHPSAISFAAQMAEGKTVHIINPNKHGSLLRSLMVFGVKVLKPESLLHVYAQKG